MVSGHNEETLNFTYLEFGKMWFFLLTNTLGLIPLPSTEDSVSICYVNEWMGTTAALQMGGTDTNAPGSPSRK